MAKARSLDSFATIGYHYGLGKHDASLAFTEMVNVLKWMWLSNTPGLLVSIFARVSIAILLIRLWGSMFDSSGSTPVSGNWDPKIYISTAFVGQGFALLLSVSLFAMVMSILKMIGLKTIANQQSDPTATDSLLEQACVIIMSCAPPLRAAMKFEVTKSAFSSLISLMRRKDSSKSSSLDDVPYKGNGGHYEDL
ncbi:hypothetical protein F5X99DRAFT_405207 [Biscogniauxia marginata]|nr:hypothetical protein F5X99DRAFT_405207 [Biscogniauxia marginata]